MEWMLETITDVGSAAVPLFWWPLLLWTLIVGGVYIVLRWRPPVHPRTQYNVRTALLFVLPIGIGVGGIAEWTLVEVPVLPTYTISAEPVQALTSTSFEASTVPDEYVGSDMPLTSKPIYVVSEHTESWFSWQSISGLGLLGVAGWWLFALYQTLRQSRVLQQMHRELKFLELEDVNVNDAELMERLRKRRVRVAVVRRAVMPMTFGWRWPVIVVPMALLKQPAALRLVVLHEWSHILRHDYPRLWFEALIEVGFGMHPLVQRLRKEIQSYRELACDVDVMRHAHDAAPLYAQLLFAMRSYQVGPFRPALHMASKPSDLHQRIQALAQGAVLKQSFGIRVGSGLLIIGLFASIALAIGGLDLVGDEIGEEVEIPLQIEKATLIVDGEVLDSNFSYAETHSQHFMLRVEQKGIILMGLAPFQGAVDAVGHVKGKRLTIQLSEHQVEITASERLMRSGRRDVFARFVPEEQAKALGRVIGAGDGIVAKPGAYVFMAAHPDQALFENPYDAIESIAFQQAEITVDGARVGHPFGMKTKTGNRSMYLYMPPQELFVLHLGYVDGAVHMGSIDGHALVVRSGSRTITVTSRQPILNVDRPVQVWGWHVPNYGSLGRLERRRALAGHGSQASWNTLDGSEYAFGMIEDGQALLPKNTMQDLATTVEGIRSSMAAPTPWMAGVRTDETSSEDLYEAFMESNYTLALAPEQAMLNGQLVSVNSSYARASSHKGYIVFAPQGFGALTLARVPFPGAAQAAVASGTHLDVDLKDFRLAMSVLVPVVPDEAPIRLWARYNPRISKTGSSFTFMTGNDVSNLDERLQEEFVID